MLVPCSVFVNRVCPERLLAIDEKPRIFWGWVTVKLLFSEAE